MKILAVNLLLFFLFGPALSMASTKKTDSCDSILSILAKRKMTYAHRVSDSTSFDQCMEISNEEKELPFSIPVACQGKKIGDMSENFKKDALSFENDPVTLDNNQKVTSFIANVRADLNDMLVAKCKGRERANIDEHHSKPTQQQKIRVEAAQ